MSVALCALWLHGDCITCPMATWPVYYLSYGYIAVILPALWLHSRYITCPMATWQLYHLACGYMAVVLFAQFLHDTCITCPVATQQFCYLTNGYLTVVLPALWLHDSCIMCPMATRQLHYLPPCRAQKLCESQDGRPELPVPNNLCGVCGRKALNSNSPPCHPALSQRRKLAEVCCSLPFKWRQRR